MKNWTNERILASSNKSNWNNISSRINNNWIVGHWISDTIESLGMAKSSRNRPQEAQTIFKVPNARTREGIPVQRLRLEAEALGAGEKLEFDRASSQNMVNFDIQCHPRLALIWLLFWRFSGSKIVAWRTKKTRKDSSQMQTTQIQTVVIITYHHKRTTMLITLAWVWECTTMRQRCTTSDRSMWRHRWHPWQTHPTSTTINHFITLPISLAIMDKNCH